MAIQIERRTVLVVGKTGAGKSTVCNQLVQKLKFEVQRSLTSVTDKIKHAEAKIPEEGTNKEYHIKVIDTIGFFGSEPNFSILRKLKTFLRSGEVQAINLVIFVFRQGRFSKEEEKAFTYFTDNFKDILSNISALVMTNCDELDDEGRQDLIREFKDTKVTESFAKFMKKGIYTVGFPDTRKMKPSLKAAYKEDMITDRNTLLDVVKSSGNQHLSTEILEDTFWERLNKSCIIL